MSLHHKNYLSLQNDFLRGNSEKCVNLISFVTSIFWGFVVSVVLLIFEENVSGSFKTVE